MLVTGIKVVDLMEPYTRGGKTGLFEEQSCKQFLFKNLLEISQQSMVDILAELVKELEKVMIYIGKWKNQV